MISLKDYAERSNISYEAVRKQVDRYKLELDGHISKIKRTRFLDDEAVAFLDSKRQENPIIIQQLDKDEELERKNKQIEALLIKVAELEEESKGLYKTIADMKDEHILLLEEKSQLQLELKEEQNKSIWVKLFGKGKQKNG